ncbi:MAG: hypothetical protein VYD19_05390 [Myxococcota bacterium]|nr:hypothetical protein [Myxococcota bacterium]
MQGRRFFGEGRLVEEVIAELVNGGAKLPLSFSGICSHFKFYSAPDAPLQRTRERAFLLCGWARTGREGEETELSFLATGEKGILAGRLESARVVELWVEGSPARAAQAVLASVALSEGGAKSDPISEERRDPIAEASLDLRDEVGRKPAPSSWGELRAQQSTARSTAGTSARETNQGAADPIVGGSPTGRSLSIDGLRPGDTLRHQRFGAGRLVSVAGETLTVQFRKPSRTRQLSGGRFEYILLSSSGGRRVIRMSLHTRD